jgi:hypothetical protein
VEKLGHQSDRDPAEGVLHELFSTRFREVERHNRNVASTLALLGDLAEYCVWMLHSVDGIDSRRGATLDSKVDCKDGEAVPIKVCKLINAWFIHDRLGIICCDGAQIIIEISARWAEHTTHGFHLGMVPPLGKQKVTRRVAVHCMDAPKRFSVPAPGDSEQVASAIDDHVDRASRETS